MEQLCMACVGLSLPRPLIRECLLLSQTLQGAPPDGQAPGAAFVLLGGPWRGCWSSLITGAPLAPR